MPESSLFTHDDDPTFEPETTAAMATALNQVCEALNINGNATAREVIAVRIIELARRGVRDPTKLRDRLLEEAGATCLWPT